MDLRSYRKIRGLSQQKCAEELGLKSKGFVSALESGADFASIRLALKIQTWSGGKVAAGSLVAPQNREHLPGPNQPAAA